MSHGPRCDCAECKATGCGAFSNRTKVHNVRDGRAGCIRSYEAEPLVYGALSPDHIGRTVIYRDHGRAEAGTITSWRDGIVFAKYSSGDTAAGASPSDLVLAIDSND